jgi:hypothetical protein
MSEPRTHPCPGGCGTQVPQHKLACPLDWARLPQDRKAEVLAAWRTRTTDPMGHLRAVARAKSWYLRNPRTVLPNAPHQHWEGNGSRANRHGSLYPWATPTRKGDDQ